MQAPRVPIPDPNGDLVKARFTTFLRSFIADEARDPSRTTEENFFYDYMAQIATMIATGKSTIYVNFQHVLEHDFELGEAIEIEYYRFDPYLKHALQEIVAEENSNYVFDIDRGQREFFVAFYNMAKVEKVRAMRTEKIGRLIAISGTVTRSSEVRPELMYGCFCCEKCSTMHHSVEQQFQYTEPYRCRSATCGNSGGFQLVLSQSTYVDWQRLRVQENADEIPAGSMPRCIDVICRNEIVETAKAGDKLVFTGSVVVVADGGGAGVRAGEGGVVSGKALGRGDNFGDGLQGLKKLGVKELGYKVIFVACAVQQTDEWGKVRSLGSSSGRSGVAMGGCSAGLRASLPILPDDPTPLSDDEDEDAQNPDRRSGISIAFGNLSEAEKIELRAIRSTPDLYNKMVKSMCPSVFGHEEVKRGILLMLFGGVHKSTKAERISLRGDINVCIVGDPSCAKSQFLKYVHGFLPRTVYTSGKSSSAAGLTASVVRDPETGEFCVEAGALMLADNGICCIDEFDKMDPYDQIAIHEAMEQQTISITKAGIQATLNARTSILAAANPVFGRYDRTKTLKANVAISAPIMSRFDLFFVILDECNEEIDEHIGRHIIEVHKANGRQIIDQQVDFSVEQLQRYIRFARSLNPRVTEESKRVLVDCYRMLRQNDILGQNKTAYRITVRQLESLIRLSEALARLHLDPEVQPVYVREAYRLLQKSIIFVESEDIELEDIEDEMNRLPLHGDFDGRGQSGDDDDDGFSDGDGGYGAGHTDDNGPTDTIGAAEGASSSITNTEQHSASSSHISIMAAAGMVGVVADDTMRATGRGGDELAAAAMIQREQQEQQSNRKKKEPSSNGRGDYNAMANKDQSKGKTKMSAKDYEEMTALLAEKLQATEEDALEGGSEEFQGLRWGDLVAWYLQQQQDLASTEAFDRVRKLVNQVIRRMAKHDGSVVVLGAGLNDASLPNEDKMLKLHPSYE